MPNVVGIVVRVLHGRLLDCFFQTEIKLTRRIVLIEYQCKLIIAAVRTCRLIVLVQFLPAFLQSPDQPCCVFARLGLEKSIPLLVNVVAEFRFGELFKIVVVLTDVVHFVEIQTTIRIAAGIGQERTLSTLTRRSETR